MSLGIVLAPAGHVPGTFPFGISSSGVNRHKLLEPYDPMYNTRGETGFYHDTQLGAIIEYGLPVPPPLPPAQPLTWWGKAMKKRQLRGLGKALGAPPTDAELSTVYGYTPTVQGWVDGYSNGQHIAWPGSWNAPSGVRSSGYYPPVGQLSGLRDGATVDDVVGVLAAHNDRAFALALVSTVAVTTSALISIFRTLRLIRKD